MSSRVDGARVKQLKDREDARFHDAHPRSIELRQRGAAVDAERRPDGLAPRQLRPRAAVGGARGSGARFTDVDGHTYSDFNIADMSMFCGYAPEPVVRAVTERDGSAATSSCCPTEDAIVVSEELGRRYGLPKWQYTLVGLAGQHRGDPRRARGDRPREGPVLRRQVPRALRPDAGGARRAGRGWCPRSAACRATVTEQSVIVPFNDAGGAGGGAGARRRRARADRAGAHEQRRAPPARGRVPRRSCGG